MRNELHLMELVDRYLDGDMNVRDRAAFEQRLSTNDELRSLMEDQQKLREAARRVPVRAAARKAYRKYRWGKWAGGGAAGAVILVAVTAAIFLWNANGKSPSGENSEASHAAFAVLSDTMGTHLPPFILTVDPAKDTTVITPNGIVLDIPKGAFVDDQGHAITTPVRVTLLEALDPLDIMKAGLSTMSGDTLLETGGMFYLDAQVNGKAVKIDPAKPLTAMVPADETKPGMMLYQGVKDARGIVDWRDPKPLKRSLVPVDITTLNFYPPGYEAKLAELGYDVTNKAFKDSLYYSFTPDIERSRDGWPWPYEQKNFINAGSTWSPDAKGLELFWANCNSCHGLTRDMTGPALKGAKAKWKGKGNVFDFVRNSQTVIRSGNPYAAGLFNQWNHLVMPPVQLSDIEIDAILYSADWSRSQAPGIDPAKVKAIWKDRFNNTNLATKAFEERMRSVHRTCSNVVLDAYVNGLDKDLGTVDSQVVAMGHSEFEQFAGRNDGRVNLPPVAAVRLRRVYEHWSRVEAEAIRKTQEKFWNAQAKQDAQSIDKRNEHDLSTSIREGELFEKELNANMDTVYKQLGMKHRWLPRTAWVVPITGPGWWNVDKAVIQATVTRSSMSYTDSRTGKTATLTYAPFTVDVVDRTSYEDLKVYLLPKQLNSFQRMQETGGSFTEKLNSIFDYDLVCLGIKDGKQQAFARNDVKGLPSVTATLQAVDDNGLRQLLRARGLSAENGLLDEARFMSWLNVDRQRSKANQARVNLMKAMLPVVFPCALEVDSASYTGEE
jgi:cytochrome c551/c552